jgi:hypothetical protein
MENYYMIILVFYFYSVTRFAVQCVFKYAGVYQLKYFLIVALIPFAGYFIAVNLLNKKLELQ